MNKFIYLNEVYSKTLQLCQSVTIWAQYFSTALLYKSITMYFILHFWIMLLISDNQYITDINFG